MAAQTIKKIAILKVFFFPDFLAGQSPEERSRSVMKELTPDK